MNFGLRIIYQFVLIELTGRDYVAIFGMVFPLASQVYNILL